MRARGLLRVAFPLLLAASAGWVFAPGVARPDDRGADEPRAARQESDATVAARVARAVERTTPKRGRQSLGVWDAQTGDPVFRRGADRELRPASVQKLATTGAALLSLGGDHELTTEVFAEWRRDLTDMPARLIVRGGGDPGFSGRFEDGDTEAVLRRLARQVAESGVKRVAGDLVLDGTAFPEPGRHPEWGHRPDQYDWWMAPVSALVLNDNCIDVTVLPGDRAGAPATLRLEPDTRAVIFDNRLKTVPDKDHHSIRFAAEDDSGHIPVLGGVLLGSTGYAAPIACVEPEAFFGDVFRRLLAEEGVTVDGRTVSLSADTTTTARDPGPSVRLERVARHGTTVREAVEVCNTRSQNLYAELLLRRLGQVRGEAGTWEGGAQVVRQVFGFGPGDPFVQIDGCGLARTNQASADDVGRILVRLFDSRERMAFMRSLPKGGDPEGTLRKRFKDKRFDGRVLAKTGTLHDTSSLAGYVRAEDGRVFAFAVLCEGEVGAARRLQDAVVSALVGP